MLSIEGFNIRKLYTVRAPDFQFILSNEKNIKKEAVMRHQ